DAAGGNRGEAGRGRARDRGYVKAVGAAVAAGELQPVRARILGGRVRRSPSCGRGANALVAGPRSVGGYGRGERRRAGCRPVRSEGRVGEGGRYRDDRSGDGRWGARFRRTAYRDGEAAPLGARATLAPGTDENQQRARRD